MGGPPGDRPRGPPRFDGDRPRFGDREGYRAGPVDLLVSLVVRKVELLWITSLLSRVLVEGLALAVDLEVVLTPTHVAIVMEYAAGGELFAKICSAGGFNEDEARFFFQQLISGVSYCHSMEICHRNLKLENTLLDGSPIPRLKICDFGYSKSGLLHSQPKSAVGTPSYIAPEVLSRKEYDGKYNAIKCS